MSHVILIEDRSGALWAPDSDSAPAAQIISLAHPKRGASPVAAPVPSHILMWGPPAGAEHHSAPRSARPPRQLPIV
jgi:hypothetical protein